MRFRVSRELDTDERAVLDLLLSAEFPGGAALRDQAADVQVVGRCDCGCPSIYLAASPRHRRAPISDGLVPSELRVRPLADEPDGDVILFVKDGRLSYLEYVHYTDRAPTAWPTNRLRTFPMSE